MFIIPTGDDLVDFIKDFTGSTNDTEIKQCIFMAEMSMRNIELPALRSNPYATENIGVADAYGRVPIPGDMNKPILFFKQGSQITTTATATGTSSQFTILLTSTPAQTISNNMLVTGTGIGSNATITNVSTGISGATITLSVANSGTVSGTLTFSTTGNQSSQSGPWIVYDRIGDRDIITQGMIAQLYLQPVNVPAVIRGKFSEVYNNYQFLPYIAQGDLINLYYYKAWPLLFAPVTDEVISVTGTVGSISGAGPFNFTITGMTGVGDLEVGDEIYATAGTGSFGNTVGVVTVASIIGSTSITATKTGGTTPTAGTVTGITQTGLTVQNNAVLQTWPEGYVYSTLREYYIKRHNETDAQIYQAKFDAAWNVVNDQNSLGKWSGGHTKLTSVWQPRIYRQYNIK
jgi:hypothetical protein